MESSNSLIPTAIVRTEDDLNTFLQDLATIPIAEAYTKVQAQLQKALSIQAAGSLVAAGLIRWLEAHTALAHPDPVRREKAVNKGLANAIMAAARLSPPGQKRTRGPLSKLIHRWGVIHKPDGYQLLSHTLEPPRLNGNWIERLKTLATVTGWTRDVAEERLANLLHERLSTQPRPVNTSLEVWEKVQALDLEVLTEQVIHERRSLSVAQFVQQPDGDSGDTVSMAGAALPRSTRPRTQLSSFVEAPAQSPKEGSPLASADQVLVNALDEECEDQVESLIMQVEDMDTDSREEQAAGMDVDINSSPVEVGASSAPSHQDEAALRCQRQERLWEDLCRYGPLLEPHVQDDLEAYCRRQLETLSQSVPKDFGSASASQGDLDQPGSLPWSGRGLLSAPSPTRQTVELYNAVRQFPPPNDPQTELFESELFDSSESGRPVTRKSVHRFVPGQWIADDMLSAWAQLVERYAAVQRKQARVLVGEWVYGEKIQSDKGCRQASRWLRKRTGDGEVASTCQIFMFPYQDPVHHNHWSLAVLDFDNADVTLLDPLPTKERLANFHARMRAWLHDMYQLDTEQGTACFAPPLSDWTFLPKPHRLERHIPQQGDADSCGWIVCLMMELTAMGKAITSENMGLSADRWTAEEGQLLRDRVFHILYHHDCLPLKK